MATTKKMTGNDVRALREGLGMTTAQFGKLLGLGPSAVTRWESKKSRAVHMDPFAGRVAEIIVSQSRKLGKTKFGEVVSQALEHEHDLFALWRVLSMAFGETVRVVKKITGGKNGKAKRAAKKTARKSKRTAKKAVARASGRRDVKRPARRAKRVARKASAKATPAKAKRAPRPRAESKITPSPAKDLAETKPGANGVPQ
jgi:hypothetical protein